VVGPQPDNRNSAGIAVDCSDFW